MIEKIAPFISEYSTRFNVPPIAIAGSIADEYHTRTGIKAIIDWFQDDILLNWMPNLFVEIDAYFGFKSKFLNGVSLKTSSSNSLILHSHEVKPKEVLEREGFRFALPLLLKNLFRSFTSLHRSQVSLGNARPKSFALSERSTPLEFQYEAKLLNHQVPK